MLKPYFKSDDKNFYLLQGDCKELLPQFEHKFDMIFADPPYFLSNNGLSIQNGQIVSVNKGTWDKSEGFDFINEKKLNNKADNYKKAAAASSNKMKTDAAYRQHQSEFKREARKAEYKAGTRQTIFKDPVFQKLMSHLIEGRKYLSLLNQT